jgi:hypothetical protein
LVTTKQTSQYYKIPFPNDGHMWITYDCQWH